MQKAEIITLRANTLKGDLRYVAEDSRRSADTPVTITKVGFEPETSQQPFDCFCCFCCCPDLHAPELKKRRVVFWGGRLAEISDREKFFSKKKPD